MGATAAGPSSAPDLTDAFWIYGGGDAAIFDTIFHGRQGWMPAWENRMGLADARSLIYIQTCPKCIRDDDDRTESFWTPWAIAVALGVATLFVAANLHLIAVSLRSQPDCVPRLKTTAEGAAGFRAASPSC